VKSDGESEVQSVNDEGVWHDGSKMAQGFEYTPAVRLDKDRNGSDRSGSGTSADDRPETMSLEQKGALQLPPFKVCYNVFPVRKLLNFDYGRRECPPSEREVADEPT
jgi:hypothetical protein